jgi:adenylylsulfate kinase-like enzyme
MKEKDISILCNKREKVNITNDLTLTLEGWIVLEGDQIKEKLLDDLSFSVAFRQDKVSSN